MIKKHNELMKFIEANNNQEVKIGINDCNILTLDVIDILSGSTYSSLKGKYKSYKKGLRLAQETYGYMFIGDLLNDIATLIEVERISIGDIVVSNEEQYSCCYICIGNGFFTASTTAKQTEIIHLSREELKQLKAYRLNVR